MRLRIIALVILLSALVAGSGYLIAAFLQTPGKLGTAIAGTPSAKQAAPMLVSPARGSEFVDSSISLTWHWSGGLAEDQTYALRLWAEELPYREIWSMRSQISVGQVIDSFSISFGKYYWQVAVLNLDDRGSYQSMASEWSAVSALQRLRRARLPVSAYAEMSATARQFADLHLSSTDIIDAVHRFVHENSATDEQLSYAPDYSDAVDLMYRHSQGSTGDLPQLLCDGRSTAMLTILKELGIESRLIFLYQSTPGWISQHTVLEVFNPDTQFWQLHDVGEDFYFLAEEPNIRVDAESLLFDSRDDIVGCPIDGSACSVEIAEQSVRYFQALRYGFTYEVWVNPDRFDLSARHEGQDNQNLAEFIGAGAPRRVTFRLDSWQ